MSYGRRTDVMFTSRKEAGQKLAAKIVDLHLFEPVVLALPRGGVPVAAEIATALKAPFDILVVRKVALQITRSWQWQPLLMGIRPISCLTTRS